MTHTKSLERSFERSAQNAVGKILLASGFSADAIAPVSVAIPRVLISRKDRTVSACSMGVDSLDLTYGHLSDPAIIDTLMSRLTKHCDQHGVSIQRSYIPDSQPEVLMHLELKAEGAEAREKIGATLNSMLKELGVDDYSIARPEPLTRFQTHGSRG